MKPGPTEFQKFDVLVGRVLPVPREELQRKGAEWRKQRKMEKRAKA